MITLDIEAVPDPRWPFVPPSTTPKSFKGQPDGYRDWGEERQYSAWAAHEFRERSRKCPHKSLVVCVGLSVIEDPWSDDDDLVQLLDGPEPEMATSLAALVLDGAEQGHSVLAWNGSHYDFRWLQWMAARCGQRELARLFNTSRHKPWERVLVDPKRDVTTYGDQFGFTLAEACLVTGYHGDQSSLGDGANVARWFAEGRIDRITHHCELDVRAFNHVVKTFIRYGMIEVSK